jgi:hypothetical protein
MLCLALVALVLTSASLAAQSQDEKRRVLGSMADEAGTANRPPLADPDAICDSIALAGQDSWDPLGDPSNDVLTTSSCPTVDDIGWVNADLSTVGASWGTEAQIQASASDGSGAQQLDPFTGINGPCAPCGPVSGSLGAAVPLLGDMVLRLEFYETFDDVADAIDANWTGGTLDVDSQAIPVELTGFSVSD